MFEQIRRSPRGAALACALAIIAVTAPTLPALADYEVALSLYRAGEYEKAAEEILVSLELAPDYAFGRALLGSCRLRLREYDAAAEAFRRAARSAPGEPRHRLMLIQSLYLADRGDEALAELERLDAAWLDDAGIAVQAARWRGLALARLGRCAEAVPSLVLAAGEDAAVSGTLARCARKGTIADELSRAIDARRREAGLDGEALLALAEAHVSAAEYTQESGPRRTAFVDAARWLAAETSGVETDAELLALLGRARIGAGDLEGATAALETAVASPSPPCRAWLTLAEARARSEFWSGALDAARRAVSCEPEHARAHVILAAAYNGLSRPDDAEAAARGALAIGESREARRQIAVAEEIRALQAREAARQDADDEARRRWQAITGRE